MTSTIVKLIKQPERILAFGRYQLRSKRRHWFPRMSAKLDERIYHKVMPETGLLNSGQCSVTQIVGLPRSGSTLLSTIVGNCENAISLSEPFLQYLQTGSFRWSDASGVENIYLGSPTSFFSSGETNDAFSGKKILFKETWRGIDDDVFPSEHFLTSNHSRGMRTIAIIRDPRASWASMIQFCDFAIDHAPTRHFLNDWNGLAKWVLENDVNYVRYEDLVSSPQREVGDLLVSLGLDNASLDVGDLRGISGQGDEGALNGGKVYQESLSKYQHLPVQVIREVELACKERMQDFGYTS